MGKYIRFDWAIKKLLRQKANYVVLEGLISTLLKKDIRINRFLEGEGNQGDENDKFNRVDILAEDERGAKYIIEVQNASETAYFQRMLFGASKLITEYINKGDSYEKVAKVYSINIVYFDLGRGRDYVYHGTTEFRGIHANDVLSLSPFQMERFETERVSDLFPEYYILRVNGFNDVATSPLEEWIDFLKNEKIPDNPSAKGLREAREIMRYDAMTREEKKNYDDHIDNIVVIRDNIETARGEGRREGKKEGLEEGIIKGRKEGKKEGLEEGEKIGIEKGGVLKNIENARKMKAKGYPIEDIAEITGLDAAEVDKL